MRKFLGTFLILLFYSLLSTVCHAEGWGTAASPQGKAWESTVLTGTTTDNYPADCDGANCCAWKNASVFVGKRVRLTNLDLANTLGYKIVVKDSKAQTVGYDYSPYGDADAVWVGPTKNIWIPIPETVSEIDVYVKSWQPNHPVIYQCVAIGQVVHLN